MKKLLGLVATTVALCSLFVGCASSGSAKSDAPVSVHPRSYVLDVIDGGAELSLVYNQYGPNYQVTPFFTSLLKKDKPQAGDTVTFKIKATADVDLPVIMCFPCSTSPSWMNLGGESQVLAENIVAGVPFESEVTFVLTDKMGGDFALCMQYDNAEQEVKAGCSSKLVLERVCESTDTTKEVPAAPHNPNVTVNLSKYAAFCQIETNHPWINGQQDMSVISNYQATPEVTAAYGDDLPQPGDVMHIVWKAVSDIDIERIYARPVDCSAAAGYWKELTKPDWDSIKTEEQLAEEAAAREAAGEEVAEVEEDLNSNLILVENVVAGVPFEVEMDVVITVAPTAQVNICLWYDVGMGEGPAIIKLVRD